MMAEVLVQYLQMTLTEVEYKMANRIQLRRGTAANWTSVNPVLAQGEAGYETDSGKLKIGDGTSNWNALTYFSGDVPTALSELTNDTGFITLAEVPAVPADVSAFNNDAGYLTSFTETDPVFAASTAAGISGTQVTNWDTAYSWGDHAAAGYALTSAIPDSILDLSIVDGTNGQVLTANGDGTFSFTTVGGVSNTLDGLTDVVVTTPSTGQVLKFDGVNWVNGSDTAGIALTDLNVTVAAAGNSTLEYDNNTGTFTYTPPDLSGYTLSSSLSTVATSGSYSDLSNLPTLFDGQYASLVGAPTIDTTNGSTAIITDGSTFNLDLTGGRAYILYKIQTSQAAWVRIYTTDAARTADASRTQGVDPGITSGVIAEAITTGAETVVFAPAPNGFNDESPTTAVMPVAVTNLSGGDAAITVTVTKMTMVA